MHSTATMEPSAEQLCSHHRTCQGHRIPTSLNSTTAARTRYRKKKESLRRRWQRRELITARRCLFQRVLPATSSLISRRAEKYFPWKALQGIFFPATDVDSGWMSCMIKTSVQRRTEDTAATKMHQLRGFYIWVSLHRIFIN